jgi:hypothetical protein
MVKTLMCIALLALIKVILRLKTVEVEGPFGASAAVAIISSTTEITFSFGNILNTVGEGSRETSEGISHIIAVVTLETFTCITTYLTIEDGESGHTIFQVFITGY